MTFHEWAAKWNIPVEAVRDYDHQFISLGVLTSTSDAVTEAGAQSRIRLEAARMGIYLWRNNVGAGKLSDGSFVRFGLANDSEKINKVIKSSDLIGVRPVTVTPGMVGRRLGQFVCREIKRPDWRYSPKDERAAAQMRWHELVNRAGGDSRFASGEGSFA